MEKETALRFMDLLGEKEKIADFLVNQQLAITGLTQNNEAFAEAFRAQNKAELAATVRPEAGPANSAMVQCLGVKCRYFGDLTGVCLKCCRSYHDMAQHQ
jgi:hypothetical protein